MSFSNTETGNVNPMTSFKQRNFMCVSRLRTLCVEIFKTLTEGNPSFMKDIFCLRTSVRPVRKQNAKNLEVATVKTASFGSNSLRSLGPQIWNKLPIHIKMTEHLKDFKKAIKYWNGEVCLCESCRKRPCHSQKVCYAP